MRPAFGDRLSRIPELPARRAEGLALLRCISGRHQRSVEQGITQAGDKAYFFTEDRYIRYDVEADGIDDGYPLLIEAQWPGLFTSGIDAPVYLDSIVWNYEHTSGVNSPRTAADIKNNVLGVAVIASSNERHGTQMTEFGQLLVP